MTTATRVWFGAAPLDPLDLTALTTLVDTAVQAIEATGGRVQSVGLTAIGEHTVLVAITSTARPPPGHPLGPDGPPERP